MTATFVLGMAATPSSGTYSFGRWPLEGTRSCHGSPTSGCTPRARRRSARTCEPRELIEEISASSAATGRRHSPSTAIRPGPTSILAELGFAYDSSLHDSPRIPRRIQPVSPDAHRVALESGRELWDPIATWDVRGRSLPIGGGVRRFMPTEPILRGLRETCCSA